MQVEPELSFHDFQPPAEVTSEVARQLERLETFSGRGQVVIHGPQAPHRNGRVFKVDPRIAMPQHKDVVVGRSHDDVPENAHSLAIHRSAVLGDAFDKLAGGSKVRFVEHEGEKGPQAGTVHLVGHLNREQVA